MSTVSPVTRSATPAEAGELRRLTAVILPGDPAGQAEAVEIALRDVDAALTCFRSLAAESRPSGPETDLPADDRRRCIDCSNLWTVQDGGRRCAAARQSKIAGAGRLYAPVVDAPRRCPEFVPMPVAADQRHGRERWPSLTGSAGVSVPSTTTKRAIEPAPFAGTEVARG